jgi:hypothetical protein
MDCLNNVICHKGITGAATNSRRNESDLNIRSPACGAAVFGSQETDFFVHENSSKNFRHLSAGAAGKDEDRAKANCAPRTAGWQPRSSTKLFMPQGVQPR